MPKDAGLRLRPVREPDLPLLDEWAAGDEHDPLLFYGFLPVGRLRARFAETGLLAIDFGVLLVVADGTPVGSVSWHEQQYGPNAGSRALNIGIRLVQEFRGLGYGAGAQRLLADYLLATYPVQRIEAGTAPENVAEQRALERAGFRRDGVLRGAQWRGGAHRDLVLYSRLRTDP